MSKISCLKCGEAIFDERGSARSVCKVCGENLSPPTIAAKTASFKDAAPAAKSKKRLIYAACFCFLLSFPLLCLGGLYWLVASQRDQTTGAYSIRLPDWIRPKPTPRVQKSTSISASEIIQIEYTQSSRRVEYPAQYFSNYTPKYSFYRESLVTLISDGRAKKHFIERETTLGVGKTENSERHAGALAPERFAELARFFVENDFLGEQDSRTSTASPTNQTLTVVYESSPSRRVKSFQAGNSDSDTPEAAAMLKAFKDLENKIDWRKQQ